MYAPHSYYRPYVFRPRFSIGFGIYAGYPVPYTYSYPYPIEVYGYGAPRERRDDHAWSARRTAASRSRSRRPTRMCTWTASMRARSQDFDGTTQPLTLTPGTHRIEVQAPGYRADER